MKSKGKSLHVDVTPNTTIARAYLIMTGQGSHELPVSLEGSYVGIVHLDDVQKAVDEYTQNRTPAENGFTVGRVMNTSFSTINSDHGLGAAIVHMLKNQHSALIVTEATEFKGILSAKSMLQYLAQISEDGKISVQDALSRQFR